MTRAGAVATAADAPPPRWGPDRPLAERITRVGRFAAIDPSQPGRVWGWRRWAGFACWVVALGGALAAARGGSEAGREAP